MTDLGSRTERQVDYAGLTVQVRYRSVVGMSVNQAVDGLRGVVALSSGAYFSHIVEDLVRRPLPEVLNNYMVVEAISQSLSIANGAVDDARVFRISYQSPYEVIVSISVASAALALVGNRVLALHDRFVQSQVVRARGRRDVSLLNAQTASILEAEVNRERAEKTTGPATYAAQELAEYERAIFRTLDGAEEIKVLGQSS